MKDKNLHNIQNICEEYEEILTDLKNSNKMNLEIEESFEKIDEEDVFEQNQTILPDNENEKSDEDEEKNATSPIFLTTWQNPKTGQILAYSVGIGAMGTEVHDISHLKMSREDFMSKAEQFIAADSLHSFKDELSQNFASQKTYPSFDEYRKTFQSSPLKMTPNS